MKKALLIEIGVEELPPEAVKRGMEDLERIFAGFLKEKKISYEKYRIFGTPRRLAILFVGVSDKQEEYEREVVGPPKKVAFDEGGNPTNALLGFLKNLGKSVEDVYTVKRAKGEYVAVKIKEGGESTKKLLKESFAELMKKFEYPKMMRWHDEFRFPRPIRWLLVLFGDETIDVSISDVKSGNITRGHRLLGEREIVIGDPEKYEELLEENYVIPSFEKRRKIIYEKLNKLAESIGGKLVEDEELLDEVTNLVEYPGVILGSFDPSFLELPDSVIITALKQHQRYFSIRGQDGRLLPNFLSAINNLESYADNIRPGLEKVLIARLEDALFYFKTDLKKKLEARVEELKGIVWIEGLGTVYEKVMRVKRLALELADDKINRSALERGILLSKTDLTTEMIKDGKEFTKLEGEIGKEYALKQGEEPLVARIIYEHHLPRFVGDELPSTLEGAYASLADKIDTIAGIMTTGYEPTGSQDPLGLRREAYTLIELILKKELRLDIKEAFKKSLEIYNKNDYLLSKILDFFFDRFEHYLEERMGIRYDIVDAVIASGMGDLVNLKMRSEVLNNLMKEYPEVFERVIIGQKRVANILKDVGELPPPSQELFEKEEERKLYEKYLEVKPRVIQLIENEKFEDALRGLLELREYIDRFFDNVFVMVEDEKLRKNRLSLLSEIKNLFDSYGDLSKIVIEGGNPSFKN